MLSNAPKDYTCPICLGNQGLENEQTLLKQFDLVYQDELVFAWINSFWIGKNAGHVIVVPKEHYESLYDLPDEVGHRIFEVSKKIALAMKEAYQCDGTTLRQNNEPAGDQHAFHYHLHIFPRYTDDNFNVQLAEGKRLALPEERRLFVHKLQEKLYS